MLLYNQYQINLYPLMVMMVLVIMVLAVQYTHTQQQSVSPSPQSFFLEKNVIHQMADEYCLSCHNTQDQASGLDLEFLTTAEIKDNVEAWEKVVRKLRARQMPPLEMPRPNENVYNAIIAILSASLDNIAAQYPNPGRTDTFRRLNRTEYKNAIRDLLALDIDVDALLPADEAGHGFDNVTVGDLPPVLLERYITAAQKISRVAVGSTQRSPGGHTIRIRPDRTQEEHVEGLPFGTRGGVLLPFTFPVDGEYEIQIRLSRDRNEHVEGLKEAHEVFVLLDREQVQSFTVKPPPDGRSFSQVDEHLKARVHVTAGPHDLGITFLKNPSSLLETKRQPFDAHFNMHRHPRITPAVFQVSINGPYSIDGVSDTPSRQKIFIHHPASLDEEEECAKHILANVMKRAYRRPVGSDDLLKPMQFFKDAKQEGGFDAGIEMALSAILVSPEFLFRIEIDPDNVEPNTAYKISDLELASRLSFFLWSSIPDEELLDAAVRGEVSDPGVFEQQVRRMLSDPRSESLVTNFAGQWLYLRNLETAAPDLRLYPDFDDNLRQSFRRETELFVESIWREDRSVLDLLQANYTFLNERLAKHYGIPHIYGSRFRRVELDDSSHRGGLLRQGSILTVTSYATRTSPVIRGHWILENMLGTPPPPPPPNVPALEDNTVSASLSVRERLLQHRANPACAGCHTVMDPVGFALENFDAVGRWRDVENGNPVDASGVLFDGSAFNGVSGLEEFLIKHQEMFVMTLTEKLFVFATGRGTGYDDESAIRRILHDAREDDYTFSSIVLGITKSVPFQMRRAK